MIPYIATTQPMRCHGWGYCQDCDTPNSGDAGDAFAYFVIVFVAMTALLWYRRRGKAAAVTPAS